MALRYMRRAEAFTAAVANLLGLIFLEALALSTLWLINLHLPTPPSQRSSGLMKTRRVSLKAGYETLISGGWG